MGGLVCCLAHRCGMASMVMHCLVHQSSILAWMHCVVRLAVVVERMRWLCRLAPSPPLRLQQRRAVRLGLLWCRSFEA